jgi:hypothetical protein
MDDNRDEKLNVYLTMDEKQRLRRAALTEGLLLATWARRALLNAAKETEK